LVEERGGELLSRVSLDELLHRAQLRQPHLQTGNATFKLRPRLDCSGNSADSLWSKDATYDLGFERSPNQLALDSNSCE